MTGFREVNQIDIKSLMKSVEMLCVSEIITSCPGIGEDLLLPLTLFDVVSPGFISVRAYLGRTDNLLWK